MQHRYRMMFPSATAAATDAPYTERRPDGPTPVFCAVGRFHTLGAVEAAWAAGAELLLLDEPLAAAARARWPGAPVRVVADVRRAYARLAQLERAWPARALTAVGVTGTNGKSTVAAWLHWVLGQLGHPTGLVGTVTVDVGVRTFPAKLTTPDARELAAHLHAMCTAGLTHVVMEASSHGLDQRRTDGVSFQVGVFTNFSSDHLDYHATAQDYLAAKRRLFVGLAADSTAVLNADDPATQVLAGATPARVLWYGQHAGAHSVGRWHADRAHVRLGAWSATAALPGLGYHRLSNALAVLAAATALGEPPEHTWPALLAFPGLWRRLQVISGPDDPIRVIDDCAHNPANLAAALHAAAAAGPRRGALHVVYAVRGRRGVAVNALNAAALAHHAPHDARLHLTWALDLAGADDAVAPDEDQVYRDELARAGRPYRCWPTVEEALGQVLDEVDPGDTVLLLGAHAMDHAADVWYRLAGGRVAVTSRPQAHQSAPFQPATGIGPTTAHPAGSAAAGIVTLIGTSSRGHGM